MSYSEIKLNFINRSNDGNNNSVVIFQQNIAEDFGEIAVAWKVIENCGYLDNHPFTFPIQFEVNATDSYGNETPRVAASDGQAYEMILSPSGNVLSLASTPSSDPKEVEVRNSLQQGVINASVYRHNKLLARKTSLAPGQKAVFRFHPRIYIGVVSQITESQIMDSAIIQSINTELNLFGLSSADIVMTGPGSKSSPFKFHLENINTR